MKGITNKVVTILLLLFGEQAFSQCIDTAINCVSYQTRNPSAASQAGSTNSWSNLSNVYGAGNATTVQNGNPAIVKESTSRTMTVTGFGFTVPTYKHICGIGLTVSRFASYSGVSVDAFVFDESVMVTGGSANLANATYWPSSPGTASYGGSGQLWGADAFSPATVNGSSFGLTFQVLLSTALGIGSATTANIDGFTMTVYVHDTIITNCSLPVELTHFSGQDHGTIQRIYWQTASETNCANFEVDWSDDPMKKGWTTIASPEGQGNSQSPSYYGISNHTFTPNKVNYYRLTQIDLNGTKRIYDDWISVVNGAVEREIVRRVDLMGKDVTESASGIQLIVYSDGSIVKVVVP